MLRLTQVELVGFRSFRDETTVRVGGSMVCFVGKNGSGKSTLCDAFQFALGIVGTSGATTRSMINNAVRERDGRRAEARVELTFVSTPPRDDAAAAASGAATTTTTTRISRVVDNGTKSAYALDGRRVKRSTIAEWLAVRGIDVGNPSRFIVAQNRASVASGLSLLHLVESVVGTLPLAAKIAALVTRIETVLTPRVVATSARIERDELARARLVDAIAAYKAFRSSSYEYARLANTIASHQLRAAVAATQFWAVRRTRAATNERAVNTVHADAVAKHAAQSAAADKHAAAAARAKAAVATLKRAERKLVKKLGSAEAHRDELQTLLRKTKRAWPRALSRQRLLHALACVAGARAAAGVARDAAAAAAAATASAALTRLEAVESDAKKKKKKKKRKVSPNTEDAMASAMTDDVALLKLVSDVKRVRAEKERLVAAASRFSELCDEADSEATRCASLQADLGRHNALASHRARRSAVVANHTAAVSQQTATRRQLRATSLELSAARRRVDAMQDRDQEMQSAKRGSSPVSHLKEQLGECMLGTLAECCSVDSVYKTAVVSVLGRSLISTVVVTNRATAIKVAEHYRTTEAGAVKCLILDELRSGSPPQPQTFASASSGGMTVVLVPLIAALRVNPRAAPAFHHLLKSYVVARSRTHAVECCETRSNRRNVVTLRGEIFRSGGEISGGKRRTPSSLSALLAVHSTDGADGGSATIVSRVERVDTSRELEVAAALAAALEKVRGRQERQSIALERASSRVETLASELGAIDRQLYGATSASSANATATTLQRQLAASQKKLGLLRSRVARSRTSDGHVDEASSQARLQAMSQTISALELQRRTLETRAAAANPLIGARQLKSAAAAAARSAVHSARQLQATHRAALKRAQSATSKLSSLSKGMATNAQALPAAVGALATLENAMRNHTTAQTAARLAAKERNAGVRSVRKTLALSEARVAESAAARRAAKSVATRLRNHSEQCHGVAETRASEARAAAKRLATAEQWLREYQTDQARTAGGDGGALVSKSDAVDANGSSSDGDDLFEDEDGSSGSEEPLHVPPPPSHLSQAALELAVAAMDAAVDPTNTPATTAASETLAGSEKVWGALDAAFVAACDTHGERATTLRALVERAGAEVDHEALKKDTALVQSLGVARERLEKTEDELRACTVEHDGAVRQRFNRIVSGARSVNVELSRVFGELTRIGDAHLIVPLERGVCFREGLKLQVKPDATPWRPFRLLSGGQQALGALALTLALHACYPQPIFILDEIDAALDAKKVEKVAQVLAASARSSGSQLLVVSHRRAMQNASSQICAVYRCEGTSRSASIALVAAT